MTVFSFHPVKHITTGEGGMVTTDNPEFANRLRKFRNHGINRNFENQPDKAEKQWYYEMDDLGFNYRLSDISCALGLSQLKRLPENISRRRDIVSKYNSEISKITGLITPTERVDNRSAWHIYPLRFDLAKFKVGRTSIFRALRAENIHVNVHYVPVHLHPYYRTKFGFRGGEYPVAESNYERLITLPLFPTMTDQDVEDVLSAVNKICRHFT
jgi:dTDP-4-amino-4,6-dideoxygalactose transaminase